MRLETVEFEPNMKLLIQPLTIESNDQKEEKTKIEKNCFRTKRLNLERETERKNGKKLIGRKKWQWHYTLSDAITAKQVQERLNNFSSSMHLNIDQSDANIIYVCMPEAIQCQCDYNKWLKCVDFRAIKNDACICKLTFGIPFGDWEHLEYDRHFSIKIEMNHQSNLIWVRFFEKTNIDCECVNLCTFSTWPNSSGNTKYVCPKTRIEHHRQICLNKRLKQAINLMPDNH